jgi:hypothetical protein
MPCHGIGPPSARGGCARLTGIVVTFQIAFPAAPTATARPILPDVAAKSHYQLCTAGRASA